MNGLIELKVPTRINYEVTYLCNYKCPFCYNKKSKIKYSSLKTIKKILDIFCKYKIYNITLTGGEPLTHPNIKEIIDYMEKLNLRIGIVTNGSLINEKFITFIKNKDCGFGVSIHGSCKEIHEKITQCKGSFKKAINGIKLLTKNNINYSLNFTATKINYLDFYNYCKYMSKLSVKRIVINRFILAGVGKTRDDLILTKQDINKLLDSMKKSEQDFKLNISFGDCIPLCIINKKEYKYFSNPCMAGISFGVVDPKGNLRFCSHAIENLGNVLKVQIDKIWQKNKFLRDYRALKWVQAKCKKCKEFKQCISGCRMSSVNLTGKLGGDYYLLKDEVK